MIGHPVFVMEPWALRETGLDLDVLAQTESVFALSNGHIGWRGNLDEGEPYGLPGSYLNGVFEIRPLPYAERGYGNPESGQTIINVTNGKVIRLLVNRRSDEMLRRRLAAPRTLHAPQLIDAEVASGIQGLVLGKKVTVPRAMEMLEDFSALRITRYPMQPHLRRVLELRENFTAYDAFYVALAEALDMPLFTGDAKFGRAVGSPAEIHVYP